MPGEGGWPNVPGACWICLQKGSHFALTEWTWAAPWGHTILSLPQTIATHITPLSKLVLSTLRGLLVLCPAVQSQTGKYLSLPSLHLSQSLIELEERKFYCQSMAQEHTQPLNINRSFLNSVLPAAIDEAVRGKVETAGYLSCVWIHLQLKITFLH